MSAPSSPASRPRAGSACPGWSTAARARGSCSMGSRSRASRRTTTSRSPAIRGSRGGERRARRQGVGAGASRLIIGTTAATSRSRATVADWLRASGVRLFNTGYAANIGVITALLARRRRRVLRRAQPREHHRWLPAVARVSRGVSAPRSRGARGRAGGGGGRRRIVVTESLFSMDGDIADLAALVGAVPTPRRRARSSTRRTRSARTGRRAGGCARRRASCPTSLIGTFGKALGTFGAFAATTARGRRPAVESRPHRSCSRRRCRRASRRRPAPRSRSCAVARATSAARTLARHAARDPRAGAAARRRTARARSRRSSSATIAR